MERNFEKETMLKIFYRPQKVLSHSRLIITKDDLYEKKGTGKFPDMLGERLSFNYLG